MAQRENGIPGSGNSPCKGRRQEEADTIEGHRRSVSPGQGRRRQTGGPGATRGFKPQCHNEPSTWVQPPQQMVTKFVAGDATQVCDLAVVGEEDVGRAVPLLALPGETCPPFWAPAPRGPRLLLQLQAGRGAPASLSLIPLPSHVSSDSGSPAPLRPPQARTASPFRDPSVTSARCSAGQGHEFAGSGDSGVEISGALLPTTMTMLNTRRCLPSPGHCALGSHPQGPSRGGSVPTRQPRPEAPGRYSRGRTSPRRRAWPPGPRGARLPCGNDPGHLSQHWSGRRRPNRSRLARNMLDEQSELRWREGQRLSG